MNTRTTRRLHLVACIALALILLGLTGNAAADAAGASKKASGLTVGTPLAGPVPLGKIPVSAKLNVKRSLKVKRARFYIGKKLVTTDRRYPFKTKKNLRFDTSSLLGGRGTLKLTVRYEYKRKNGKLKRRTLTRKISLATESGQVGQSGEPDPTGPTSPPSAPPGHSNGCDGTSTPNDDSATGALPYAPARLPTVPEGMLVCDEFNGDQLDRRLWNDQRRVGVDPGAGTYPWFAWNATLEGAHYSPDNVSVGGGMVTMQVTDAQSGDDPYWGHITRRPKTTGSINTDGKFAFQYGTMEARIKIDQCTACWQSFWLHKQEHGTENNRPEYDIMEFMPWAAAFPHTVLHGLVPPPAGEDDQDGEQTGNFSQPLAGYTTPLTDTWHTYRITRTPTRMTIIVDNNPAWSYTTEDPNLVTDKYMFAILSMAIFNPVVAASDFGMNLAPAPAGTKLQVDYLKVWKLGYGPDQN